MSDKPTEDYDKLTLPENEQKFIEDKVSEKDLLNFAKICLVICAGIYIIAGICSGLCPNFKDFFEKSSLAIPPIVTLILGFYFGKKS